MGVTGTYIEWWEAQWYSPCHWPLRLAIMGVKVLRPLKNWQFMHTHHRFLPVDCVQNPNTEHEADLAAGRYTHSSQKEIGSHWYTWLPIRCSDTLQYAHGHYNYGITNSTCHPEQAIMLTWNLHYHYSWVSLYCILLHLKYDHIMTSSSYRGIQLVERLQVVVVVLVTEISKGTPREAGKGWGRVEWGRGKRRRGWR